MKYIPVALGVIACLAVGFTAGMLQSHSLAVWYPYLQKSRLTPPDWIFPIAWTTLYVMMGISIGLVWMKKPEGYKVVTGIFAAQLAVNFLWSVTFFMLKSPRAGLVTISALLPLLLVYAYRCRNMCRASSYLFIPYILWVGFAWYLNLYIALHN